MMEKDSKNASREVSLYLRSARSLRVGVQDRRGLDLNFRQSEKGRQEVCRPLACLKT